MIRFVACSLALMALCVVFVGCGQQGVEGLQPVTGTVTLDGKPVDGASITFKAAGQGGRGGFAMTGPDGKFTLNAVGGGEGALAGKYQVGVVKMAATTQTAATSAAESEAIVKERMASGAPLSAPSAPPKHFLPEKYATPESSGLEVEVKAGTKNDFPLDLKS
jgi:hypothetical protein